MDMSLDLEKYADKYFNLSMEDIKKIRDDYPSDLWFEAMAKSLHHRRGFEIQYGKRGLRTQPLIHVLSLTLQPKPENEYKPLVIYGEIYAQFHDFKNSFVHNLYKRGREVAETLGTDGKLTLNCPNYSCLPYSACMPLFKSEMNVNLVDASDNVFARTSFYLDETDNEDVYEQVKFKSIPCEQGYLNVQYVTIPFGIHCRIEVTICDRQCVARNDILNVNGKIVVRYRGHSSEECVLFEKQDTEFERVEIDHAKEVHLSRCWVSLPAYSSLVVGLNLSEFETRRNIVNDTVDLVIENGRMSTGSTFLDDIAIKVHVAWFSPNLLGGRNNDDDYHFSPSLPKMNIEGEIPTEEMDIEGEYESSEDESDDALSPSAKPSWGLCSHQTKPWPSPALEIFSVSFGRKGSKSMRLYGSIEILCDDTERICDIFKRNVENALMLSENTKFIPIPDGPRVFEDCVSLQMKFDIKDVEGYIGIRGLVDWAASVLDTSLYHEKQLCSFIPGENGTFAAVHYSIFSEAVGVNIKVLLNPKAGYSDLNPKIWGSIVAQYSCFDYSSLYNKDNYRSVLFKKIEDDQIQVGDELTIPLSRSMVVVPAYSSLIVNVDLSFGGSNQKFSCVMKMAIGEGFKTEETNDYVLRIELDWHEIK